MGAARILVLRFSAMGDVALLAPVVHSLVSAQDGVRVTVATRPKFAPLFDGLDRVTAFPADLDGDHRGLRGLLGLFAALRQPGADLVLDLHDNLRTRILRPLFRFSGAKVVVFDKGNAAKRAFTRKNRKVTAALPHTVERYRLAFEVAGVRFANAPLPPRSPRDDRTGELFGAKSGSWVGVAPFARHRTKIWPLENYALLFGRILPERQARFFLFGHGERETGFLWSLKERFPAACEIVAGRLGLKEELDLMRHLDLMVCVDSANMHLAALAGTPLVSVWGGTHPDVGFSPYGTGEACIVQIDRQRLPCRPCSVYGKERCHRGDFACLRGISVEQVAEPVLRRC